MKQVLNFLDVVFPLALIGWGLSFWSWPLALVVVGALCLLHHYLTAILRGCIHRKGDG